MTAVKRRDKDQTRQALILAVGTVIAKDGYTKTGVSKVAREAGVDKALVYRYFGGFSQLLQAYAENTDIWWTVDDMMGEHLPGPREESLAAWLSLIFERHVDFLNHHPVILELLTWEMAERNALTIALEYVREQRSLALMKRLLARFGQTGRHNMVHYGPIMAMLSAAGNYLAARGRYVQNFNGLDLGSDRGWQQLFQAVETMLRGIVQEHDT